MSTNDELETRATRHYDRLRREGVSVQSAAATVQRELGEQYLYLPETFWNWLTR